MKKMYLILLSTALFVSCGNEEQQKQKFNLDEMMIRISEIEIEPEYLDEYLSILKEESKASVELEPGVISIFPMYQKENPTEIRILEIYENRKAYETHLETHILNTTKRQH